MKRKWRRWQKERYIKVRNLVKFQLLKTTGSWSPSIRRPNFGFLRCSRLLAPSDELCLCSRLHQLLLREQKWANQSPERAANVAQRMLLCNRHTKWIICKFVWATNASCQLRNRWRKAMPPLTYLSVPPSPPLASKLLNNRDYKAH